MNGTGRDRHRRGCGRLIPAPPTARARAPGTSLRSRHRCRRHLVLEPLSRCALRFGELVLRLFLLRGALAGVGVARALRRPARHPSLSQLRGRQVRPAAGHPVRLPRRRRALRRGGRSLDDHAGERRAGKCQAPDHGAGAALGLHAAQHSRPREFYGAGLPHLALAARGRVARGQARRHHRHGCDRHPGHPDHRRRGRPSHGVPAHAQLGGAPAQPAHHPRGAEEDQGILRRDLRALPADQHLLHPPDRSAQGAGSLGRGARGVLGEALWRAGLRHLGRQLRRRLDRQEGQRARQRLHGRKRSASGCAIPRSPTS